MSFFFSTRGSAPIWILGLLFLALVILSFLGYRSRGSSSRRRYRIPFLFRTGTFLTVTILLGNLAASWRSTFASEPLLKVFFDNSVSAAYHQSISGESLLNGYREIAAGMRGILESESRGGTIEFYSFGSEVRPVDPEDLNLSFSEPTTNLSSVLKQAIDVRPDHFLAGIVVVTDGQVTMGPDPKDMVQEIDVPVHAVGIGNSTPMVDVDIERVEAPTVGVRGDMVTAEVFVSSIGETRERVHVTLSKNGRLLGSQMIRLSGLGSVRTVKFRFRLEESGSQTYKVQVAALKDEVNIDNNRSAFAITTLKDRFRVALLTGALSPNTGFISRVLETDKGMQTDHFVRHRKGWSPPIARFWRTDYDLVILDNFPADGMVEDWAVELERKLSEFPSSLIYLPGPNVPQRSAYDFLPLLGMEEMRKGTRSNDTHYAVRFSEASRRHPIFGGEGRWGVSFPPLKPYLMAQPATERVTTLVYLDAPVEIPLFTAGTVDFPRSGKTIRIATITSTDLWQLHFRIMRTDYAGVVERWWGRTLKWLVMAEGEGETYFRLNKHTFQQGETVHVSGSVLDLGRAGSHGANVSMVINDEHGETKSILLDHSPSASHWEGDFLAGKPGEYHYVVKAEQNGILKGQQEGSFRVEESQIELNRVFLNESLLTDISSLSGGEFRQWADRSKVHENLNLEAREVIVARTFHLSHWLPLCVVALIFMIGEWVSRRLLGLQ
ncbi:MAG: vWA domain-containing protein [Candidatus Neomarinimicrobiota bacterium]